MSCDRARFDAWRSVGFAAITNSYTALGTPLGHEMRLLHFINGTDKDMAISFDGTTNNIPVLAGAAYVYDVTSNEDANEHFRYQRYTQLYIKYLEAPTSGTFYVTAVYGKGE